ncbi:MAG: surface carbohydrate biosynthesis protein [Actinomycetota bacterium]
MKTGPRAGRPDNGVALIVDNPKRDLAGIALLGHELVQRGLDPHLVPMNIQVAEVTALPVSSVLINYLRPNNEALVGGLIAAGMPVAICDTEGAVYRDAERLVAKMSRSDEIRGAVAAYCAWGEFAADYLTENGYHRADQVELTGSPRFDFYSSDWRDVTRRVHETPLTGDRPVVMLCGSFPFANSAFGEPAMEIERRIAVTGLDRAKVDEEYAADCAALASLVALANRLASEFPEVDFVYRPHPFERVEAYDELLEPLDNLSVHASGTVDGWLLNVDFVIVPADCTIGIEAAMAGVPAVIPTWLGSEEAPSVTAATRSVETDTELLEALRAAIEMRDDPMARAAFAPSDAKDVVHRYFGPIDGESHQRVADVVQSRLLGGPAPSRRALRSIHYRQGDANVSRQARALYAVRMALRLPAFWSFRRFSAPTSLSWDRNVKVFGAPDVNHILDAINDARPELTPVRALPVEQDRYDFGYRQGRSLRLVASG